MAMGKIPHSDGGDSDGEGGILAEINITPLTDIFLVLLIIFMVTTSVATQTGIDVELPKAAETTSVSTDLAVVLTLGSGGNILVNGETLQAEEPGVLEAKLREAFTKTQSRTVILEGDEKAFLGAAISVLDEARAAGAESFAIATRPKD